MVSGECVVAPSTPKPPARLTAATTSRQWLKASKGNSIPSMSQIGDFMAVSLPVAAVRQSLIVGLCVDRTLAYRGSESQARWRDPHPEEAAQRPSRRMQARLWPHG